eukprot:scaffold13694_cov143-Skeletonema_menzelii.AAC.1
MAWVIWGQMMYRVRRAPPSPPTTAALNRLGPRGPDDAALFPKPIYLLLEVVWYSGSTASRVVWGPGFESPRATLSPGCRGVQLGVRSGKHFLSLDRPTLNRIFCHKWESSKEGLCIYESFQ